MNLPRPLQILDEVNKNYPKLFDFCTNYLAFLKDSFAWNESCFCPLEVFRAIMEQYAKENNHILNDAGNYILYNSLFNWKRYCQIYDFDSDFVNVLIKSATDNVRIDEALACLPFPSFYVNINGENEFVIDDDFLFNSSGDFAGGYVTGFFVNRNASIHPKYDYNKSEEITTVSFDVYLSGGASFSYEICIGKGMTLKDSFEYMRSHHEVINMTEEKFSTLESAIEKIMVMLFYICAINADMTESKKQKTIRKTNINPTSKIAKEVKKIKINDVGYEVGKAIRLSTTVESDVENNTYSHVGSHSPKRPHQRRAHFHTYWVGSEKDGSRHTEIKWVNSIFVHLNSGETVTKITPVKV